VVAARRGRSSVAREGGRLVVTTPDGAGLDALVERWYRGEARRVIAPRAHALAAALGGSVARIAIRDPRSRWGSCSTTGTLSFSWRLLLAPERILDYVVAHEVCHLRRPDHSGAFWSLVEEVFPGQESARRWLRENGPQLQQGPAWRSLSPA
jgi:predicted metal-dependent hydrolase